MIAEFEALLAPLGMAAFFADHYEKKHLHLRSDSVARRGLTSSEELWQILVEFNEFPENIVCFPEHFGTTRTELSSNAAALRAYLDAGHPLVWNRAWGVSKRIDETAAFLARVFGGHVWPNVYSTGTAGTPFDMHFDAHEVIAIHCEGEKQWDISRVRIDRPLEANEMAPAIRHALRSRVEEASGKVADTLMVRPGDLVYIPRGQFHNARTLEGRSLHVTFGIELPTGFDLAKRIVMESLADPVLREYPMPAIGDPDGEWARAWSSALAARIHRMFSAEVIAAVRDEVQTAWIDKSNRRNE